MVGGRDGLVGAAAQSRVTPASPRGPAPAPTRNQTDSGTTALEILKIYACAFNNRVQVRYNGSWSSWTQWSDCSVPCGLGEIFRNRSCNSPAPSMNGFPCVGNDYQSEPCTNSTYINKKGKFVRKEQSNGLHIIYKKGVPINRRITLNYVNIFYL
ncbi:TSP2-like protein, partial [Mya arenaria]